MAVEIAEKLADYGFGTVNDTKYSISKIGDLVVTADDAMNERVD